MDCLVVDNVKNLRVNTKYLAKGSTARCYRTKDGKVLKQFRNIKRNYKDRDYYVYKNCNKCKTTLKLPLPKKKGIQHVKCPKCNNKLKFICLRCEKVEVIKNKKK